MRQCSSDLCASPARLSKDEHLSLKANLVDRFKQAETFTLTIRLPDDPKMSFLFICVIIFVGSLLAGLVPFALQISAHQIGILAAFGAGLLVSTALAVILPEGMEAFHDAQEESESHLPHAIAGLAITAGFALMLLVDHIQGGKGHSEQPAHDSDEEISEAETGLVSSTSGRDRLQAQQEAGSRAFMGLLVHSLADGVAVGSTGITDKEELKLVVAFAMILHKLPATFGLVSFLMASRWPKTRIKAALVGFAASAPLMALATFWILVAIPSFSSPTAVALWLLASGGTFLYASCMHVLPHVAHTGQGTRGGEHALTHGQVAAVLAGCAVPLCIQFLSVHQH